ncbi:Polyadenylate-binding protein/Hyperplastic disc protein [Sesbania bispinosa]|nr:Polyadenylate-binding protein/Hyperplastic disc protein [Sesbania bispinosa]
MRPVAIAPNVAPRMPLYPPGAPGLGHNFCWIWLPAATRSWDEAWWCSTAKLLCTNGSAANKASAQQDAEAGPVQQPQQPVPLMQQQGTCLSLPSWTQHARCPTARVAGGMLSVPYDMGGLPIRDAVGQPMPIQALATALANAPPEQQRTMLGEALYPLVDQLEHDAAAKVTGMLLEMDQPEPAPADQLASLSLNDSLVS